MAGVSVVSTLLVNNVNFTDSGAGFVVSGVVLVGCRSVRFSGEGKEP